VKDPGDVPVELRLGQRVGRILIGLGELAAARADPGGSGQELRSAFAIGGPHVLTAWHCTGKDPDAPLWFRLRVPGGGRDDYHYVPVRVASHDASLDVAVLSVDPSRLAAGGLTAADATSVLAKAAIPLAAKVASGTSVRVMGFSQSKPANDGDTYDATVVDPTQVLSGLRCMKLRGEAFAAELPVAVRGLSGGPVLRAVDPDQGEVAGDVAVGIVRLSVGVDDAASMGGELLATSIADAAGLTEIGEALRDDVPRTHRRPDYARQIELLTPVDLLDRRAELEALADFARPGSAMTPYAIWTGIPGSGKTALAAHFALHPPPQVDVVAYFVSRFKTQQTQQFWASACDQLAALLDRRTLATGSAEFVSLWEDAGAAAAKQGRTLLLLIDGLDENDPPPIAPWIPKDGDATRRVLIFTTPSASGADRGFWLPTGKVLRQELVKSKHAQDAADDISLIVDTRLSERMRDTLGVMAAAESPLSAADITELLYEEGLLRQSASVSLLVPEIKQTLDDASSLGLVSPMLEDPERYAFEPRVAPLVTDKLGAAAIDGHREQITAWANRYAELGWPPHTPRYLLTGYPGMLDRAADSARLLALTTPSRINALRAVTGDETAALEELALVLGHLANTDPPDVATACRTALRREQMLRAMAWYPVTLIRAKAALGEWAVAHRLASHLERPEQRAQALMAIGYDATDAGKAQVGRNLLVDALQAVGGITQPYWRMSAIGAVAQLAMHATWPIGPQTVAEAFTDPAASSIALIAFAQCAMTGHRMPDALGFLTEAYRIAASADTLPAPEASDAPDMPGTLIGLAAVDLAGMAALSGDSDTVVKATTLIPGRVERIHVLTLAYLVSAATGKPADHVTTALLGLREPVAAIADPSERALPLAALARAFAICGQSAKDLLDSAASAARDTAEPDARATAFMAVAEAAVFCGQSANELLAQAREAASQSVADQATRAEAVAAIGAAMAAENPEGARAALAADLADPGWRAYGLAAAVPAAAIAGQPTDGLLAEANAAAGLVGPDTVIMLRQTIMQAERAAADATSALSSLAGIDDPCRREAASNLMRLTVADTDMTDPGQRAKTLVMTAVGIALAGGNADEIFLASRAAAASVVDPGQRAEAQYYAWQSAAGASCFDAAAEIAVDITDPGQRALILAAIARAAASDGRSVDELIEKACQAVGDMPDLVKRHWTLRAVVAAAVAVGCFAAAEKTAADVIHCGQRASILADIAKAAAIAGHPADELIEKARQLAAGIADPAQRAWATGEIIQAAVAAGNTGVARQLAAEASQDAMVPDPSVRAIVLGLMARAADGLPPIAAGLFADACRATDFAGPLRRSFAITELSYQAAGRDGWPDFLAAEVLRAGNVTDALERTQVLVALAQAADESGNGLLAQHIAAQIPDPGGQVWALINLGQSAARGDPAAADSLFRRAYQVAGLPGACVVDWAPAAIAQAAAASLRVGLAVSAAQAIPWLDQRTTALAAVDAVARMSGAEPDDYSPPPINDDWRGVLAQAAYTVGWFGVAAELAEGLADLNFRAYLLLRLAGAAAEAGDSDHASAAVRAVLDLKGRIDRSMLGRALAAVVSDLAGQDQDQARRELVLGMTDCFHPDLFGIAQKLAPETIGVLAMELGVELPAGICSVSGGKP
jgi:hypothetical protein